MTTLSFTRKNNLLSLLRGYDLPAEQHNYLNSALLGFGNHHHHHHHHHHHKKENKTSTSTSEERSEKKYIEFLNTVADSLVKYLDFFSKHIPDDSFWYDDTFFKALCAFTRYFVASKTETSSEFLNNIEGFLTDIADSEQYISLLDVMDDFADEYKKIKKISKSDELPKEYITLKEQSGNDIRKISIQCLNENVLDLDPQTIINLILNCIVYSTQEPQEFQLNFEKYKQKVTNSYDKDISRLFSEDLQDTAYNDDLESEGEGDSEDEGFVVPDDEVEYEDDGETPVKRRKVVHDDDEEGEINGSGFYNWWW